MTKDEYAKKLRHIKRVNVQKAYRKSLQDEKKKYNQKLNIETSKLIAIYLFVLLNAIVIYAMIAMWRFGDLSYLGVLISDIAAQVLIYAIYCLKAYKAKKSEEDMKFRREKYSDSFNELLNAGADSQEFVPVNGNIDTFGNNENAVG